MYINNTNSLLCVTPPLTVVFVVFGKLDAFTVFDAKVSLNFIGFYALQNRALLLYANSIVQRHYLPSDEEMRVTCVLFTNCCIIFCLH